MKRLLEAPDRGLLIRRTPMHYWTPAILAVAGAVYWASITYSAQSSGNADAHIDAARQAAGQEYLVLFDTICKPATTARAPAEPPTRSKWYAEPAKVFDNLYFVGQAEHSAWAVTTSE